ncbi:Mitochondrial inner membrane protease subunit 2 [Dissostichus eleginoides]|uniref:Mitochondrial inner membrane protease subunit 2 n=1 Tax=Dissostichus eleginoides TaxID=100907 RepID=A0AAD9F325_DISEL|nr:Mitochondrial inner membrane protease subunit 2 [Dissostichus eleginoides]
MIARGGNTSSLLPHLNRKHLLEYEAKGTIVLFTSLSDGVSCFLFPVQVMAQQAGRRYMRAFVSGFFVAVPVTVTALDRLAYVARVEGASMQPSLNPEGGSDCDVVLLNRWSVRNYEVQRGDVVSVM